jgi:hypothetical protein
MIMKSQCVCHKMMVLCACLLIPSIACAHGVTTEGLAVYLLRVDFVILLFAALCVFISQELNVRLMTLFSTVNVGISIIGILLKVLVSATATTSSSNDFFSFSAVIALYATGYLVFAVPIYLLLAPILALLRRLFKKPVISKSGINEQKLDQTQPAPAIHNSFGGKT